MGNIFRNDKYYFPGLELNLYSGKVPYFLSDKYFSNMNQVHEYLNSTKGRIYNKDYRFILKKANKGDFVFLDPPYIESHDYRFNYNEKENITDQFISELHTELQELDKRGVLWLMTQADTVAIRKTFKKYKIVPFPVFRGYTNTYTTELIIKNY